MLGFPPAHYKLGSTMKGNDADVEASGDGERQCEELPSVPISLTVFWEAAEELLQVCVKAYVPCGSRLDAWHVCQVFVYLAEGG